MGTSNKMLGEGKVLGGMAVTTLFTLFGYVPLDGNPSLAFQVSDEVPILTFSLRWGCRVRKIISNLNIFVLNRAILECIKIHSRCCIIGEKI